MIALLLSTLLLKARYKNECINWIYIFNSLVAWLYSSSLIIYAGQWFMAWYGQNPYEWYTFSNPSVYITLQKVIVIGTIIYIAGVLFFIRKLRINRWYILLFLFALNFEFIIRLMSGFYGDYLPWSWSISARESIAEKVIKWLAALLVPVINYWIAYKKKKLPYPSVFLK